MSGSSSTTSTSSLLAIDRLLGCDARQDVWFGLGRVKDTDAAWADAELPNARIMIARLHREDRKHPIPLRVVLDPPQEHTVRRDGQGDNSRRDATRVVEQKGRGSETLQ